MSVFVDKMKKPEVLDNYRFLPGEEVGEKILPQPRTYARFALVQDGKIVPIAPDPIPLDEWAHVVKEGVVQANIKRVRMRTLGEVWDDLHKALDVVVCEKPGCGWESLRKEREYDRKCQLCGGDTYWFIDEYIHGPEEGQRSQPVPHNHRWVACWPCTGGSEGHYVHVDFHVPADPYQGQEFQIVRMALAKTFRGMNHASEIARRCAVLLGA